MTADASSDLNSLGRIKVGRLTQFLLRYGTIPAAGNSNSSLSSLIVHTYLCVRFSERCLHHRPRIIFLLVLRVVLDSLMLLAFPIVYKMMGLKSG